MKDTRRRERGQGLVEFALLLPILVMIAMGAIDFARIYFTYTTLVNASREGAMHGALHPMKHDEIRAVVAAEVNGQVQNLQTQISGGNSPGQTITVTVRTDFVPATTAVVGRTTIPIRTSTSMVVR